jgi:hypothetical protein
MLQILERMHIKRFGDFQVLKVDFNCPLFEFSKVVASHIASTW